jgi:hypothetical protein
VKALFRLLSIFADVKAASKGPGAMTRRVARKKARRKVNTLR